MNTELGDEYSVVNELKKRPFVSEINALYDV